MSKPYRRAICWVRRDLRLKDHSALALATEQADSVAVVFVFDTAILDALEDKDDRRLTFIHRSLSEMDEKLRKVGSRLLVLHGDPSEEIPKLAKSLDADVVFTGRDYEPYAKTRDAKVEKSLQDLNKDFHTVKDSVIFEAGEVLTGSHGPFRVFTPYSRAWHKVFQTQNHADNRRPHKDALWPIDDLPKSHELKPLKHYGFEESELWLEAGEDAGLARLKAFVPKMRDYAEQRNFPAVEGTSALSAHLRFGTISIRAAIRSALEHNADKWLTELIWRDFYQDVLAHFPEVVDQTFQPQYRDINYPGTEVQWQAWCDGMTGYPLVDAAMRCFNATGYMHNRLRMIVASFLTKDLLVDYKKGEAYFARYLLDFDLASNNGGWQWAASTGCDAQPYFRIFNPVTQSERFDPDGKFIREWLPELKDLDGPAIHFPSRATSLELTAAGIELGKTYPKPIVNHDEMRPKAIALLADARDKT